MIVGDTNILVHFLVVGVHTDLARSLYKADPDWTAPPLWRSELRSAASLFLRRQLRSLAEARELVAAAEELIGDRQHDVDSRRVLELAARSNCTSYDCEFVALAEPLGVSLVTSDHQLLAALPRLARSMHDFARDFAAEGE